MVTKIREITTTDVYVIEHFVLDDNNPWELTSEANRADMAVWTDGVHTMAKAMIAAIETGMYGHEVIPTEIYEKDVNRLKDEIERLKMILSNNP